MNTIQKFLLSGFVISATMSLNAQRASATYGAKEISPAANSVSKESNLSTTTGAKSITPVATNTYENVTSSTSNLLGNAVVTSKTNFAVEAPKPSQHLITPSGDEGRHSKRIFHTKHTGPTSVVSPSGKEAGHYKHVVHKKHTGPTPVVRPSGKEASRNTQQKR